MTVASPSPMLLLPQVHVPVAVGVSLPAPAENLFERLIRDPTTPNRPARERLCAEMLCGLLINAPMTRQALIRLLAELAGGKAKPLEELDWQFATEQAIGAKRDDLRIVGSTHDDEPEKVVLWTVEVKVGAGIHVSSDQPWDEDEDTAEVVVEETDRELVSQIQNYDAWLAKQSAKHRAGFVLAITDQSQNIPSALSMPWHCLTWTDLALCLEDQLREQQIPDAEQVLARHFCGFVRSHLWNEDTMSDNRFGFDDLALMRAFAQIGFTCFGKVKDLVAGCQAVLEEQLTVDCDKPRLLKALNGPANRSAAYVTFHAINLGRAVPPTLYAGIEGGQARVWIENPQSSPAKQIVRRVVQQHAAQLQKRNGEWEVVEDSSSWADLSLRRPLEWLLTADDQQAALNEFVAAAVSDLKASGLITELAHALNQEQP